jgi:capsular polysaccharide biosynthesis protein
LLVGVVAAIALAVLRQRFERRLRYPEAFERARGVPVLGIVPHLSSLRRLERGRLVGRG